MSRAQKQTLKTRFPILRGNGAPATEQLPTLGHPALRAVRAVAVASPGGDPGDWWPSVGGLHFAKLTSGIFKRPNNKLRGEDRALKRFADSSHDCQTRKVAQAPLQSMLIADRVSDHAGHLHALLAN